MYNCVFREHTQTVVVFQVMRAGDSALVGEPPVFQIQLCLLYVKTSVISGNFNRKWTQAYAEL
jgi:hypothetical protein